MTLTFKNAQGRLLGPSGGGFIVRDFSSARSGDNLVAIFHEKAGHLLFEGPLEKVTVRRGDSIAFTAYQGADEGVLEQYERDVIAFAKSHTE